jgi:peptidoglycan hydrolase-like protein with peptidoglycan-binding domain
MKRNIFITLPLVFTIAGCLFLSPRAKAQSPFGNASSDLINYSSCINLTVNLARNSARRADVTSLQQFLFDNGYLGVQPTGNYLNMTVQAVKDFQSANELTVNGIADLSTRTAIKNQTCTASDSSDTSDSSGDSSATGYNPFSTGSSGNTVNSTQYNTPSSTFVCPVGWTCVKNSSN